MASVEVTVSDIRERFPEFNDEVSYPDSMIQFDIDDALDDINNIYAAILRLPLRAKIMAQLLVAHYLTMSKRSQLGDSDSISPVSSKSLGPASTSYQSSEATSELKASLNSTVYGQRFLMKLNQWRIANYPWINL